jgi:hypothetical protein
MKIKNLFNNENKTKLIGLLTILISLWLVLYFIPELFLSLFNTLLGNLILIIAVLLVYTNNRIYGLISGLVILLLYRFSRLSKEGFSLNVTGSFNIDDQEKQQPQEKGKINYAGLLGISSKYFEYSILLTIIISSPFQFCNIL